MANRNKRKYSGKTYFAEKVFPTKGEAQKAAQGFRRIGFNSRITRERSQVGKYKGKLVYVVWISSG